MQTKLRVALHKAGKEVAPEVSCSDAFSRDCAHLSHALSLGYKHPSPKAGCRPGHDSHHAHLPAPFEHASRISGVDQDGCGSGRTHFPKLHPGEADAGGLE